MKDARQTLRDSLVSIRANRDFTEAVIQFADGSRLAFCHRVGERWAKAVGPTEREDDQGLAGKLLAAMAMFRLNAKHLDISFADGSRWDERIEGLGIRGEGSAGKHNLSADL